MSDRRKRKQMFVKKKKKKDIYCMFLLKYVCSGFLNKLQEIFLMLRGDDMFPGGKYGNRNY